MLELPLLADASARALASLLGIGCRSGDTVVGLSAVRRTAGLAFVFASSGLAERTLRELAGKPGVRVYQLVEMQHLTRAFGREDAQVVGVKRGYLAHGLTKRLKEEKS